MADYAIPGIENLQLHHFYRAMAWLGEETGPIADGALAPRCIEDRIEEALFARRRDLFSELSVVFMDTTTLSFEGAGGETLGAHGHSKDHRPDLKQMVLAVVIDGEGRPICTEMLAGNTADVTLLLPVIDRLRERFAVGRVCVVADRGMIATATIAALEERGLEDILGTRERTDGLVRELVLTDNGPFTPLLIERARGETQLFVKEVKAHGARYIVCRNEAEAEKDRADRQAIVGGLEKQLRKGDKALIGNSAYRRYLRRVRTADGESGPAFEIDPGKLALEARYDGIFVLRTNARITPLQAVLRYRDLLQVEDLFRRAKAVLRTRPIYHSSDAAIRGHVFCSFLALVLQKELADRCRTAGVTIEWADLLRHLDRLQEATIEKDGKRITTRTPVAGQVGRVFQAAGVALPPNMREHAA
jgi:transposase